MFLKKAYSMYIFVDSITRPLLHTKDASCQKEVESKWRISPKRYEIVYSGCLRLSRRGLPFLAVPALFALAFGRRSVGLQPNSKRLEVRD